ALIAGWPGGGGERKGLAVSFTHQVLSTQYCLPLGVILPKPSPPAYKGRPSPSPQATPRKNQAGFPITSGKPACFLYLGDLFSPSSRPFWQASPGHRRLARPGDYRPM